MGDTMISSCGNCAYARLLPGDMTKRACRGGPPQLVVMPTPRGPALQTMFPVVGATDEACGAFKPVVTLSKGLNNEAQEETPH